jgi:choline kinase
MKNNVSVIISCAGMGTRLGLGCTKALVEIEGKTLIERQLEILKDYDDIRIVVGYQAEKVMDVVNSIRKDVLFVFNHEYRTTGTGASFSLGAKYGREYVVALDGDLLVHPDDLIAAVEFDGSCVGGTTPSTDNPWLMPTQMRKGVKEVTGFSREFGDYEWTGLAKIRSDMLKPGAGHVFHLIEPLLPIPMIFLRTKEIDTIDDYERAVAWVRNNYED